MDTQHKDRTQYGYEYFNSRYIYDPTTGFLYNKRLKRNVGVDDRGYRIIKLRGMPFRIHRIGWLLHYGAWPTKDLDHINGDKADNRIQNLREATTQQNLQNRGRFRNNKLGVKGVCQVGNRYRAQLWRDGRFVLAKNFDTIEEAAAAYREASLKYFGEFARLETALK